MSHGKRLALWVSDKKAQKYNWTEFELLCAQNGYELFNVDIRKTFHSQGPIHIFVHKLTDVIASAKEGNLKSILQIKAIEDYINKNPSMIVIDPLEKVRNLLNRYTCYRTVRLSDLYKYGVFIPNFCELKTNNLTDAAQMIRDAGVTYPLLCKPSLGHGSNAHKMSIIFNEDSLSDYTAPCVVQSFINHNAVLYKIYIVGTRHYLVQRPSIKNFHGTDFKTITFHTGDVSKAGASSHLCVLDPEDEIEKRVEPNHLIVDKIASIVREIFGMDLLGVDFVIDNKTGKIAIIDVNVFPGYDEFPNFFESLIELIKEKESVNIKDNTKRKSDMVY